VESLSLPPVPALERSDDVRVTGFPFFCPSSEKRCVSQALVPRAMVGDAAFFLGGVLLLDNLFFFFLNCLLDYAMAVDSFSVPFFSAFFTLCSAFFSLPPWTPFPLEFF